MTDEQRAELRLGVAKLIGLAAHLPADPEKPGFADVRHNRRQCIVEVWLPESRDPVPLTPAQHLALSVLIGDESVLPQALADYLLDQGHEYATACYEKGKRDATESMWVRGDGHTSFRIHTATPPG